MSVSSPKSKELHITPWAPTPSIRHAFWSASSKPRPMAITSPTLFISLPMRVEAPWNFPRSQRGSLQTR